MDSGDTELDETPDSDEDGGDLGTETPDSDEDGGDSDVTGGMVLIPAGEFQMGSIDADADDDEEPVHTVYVDAFYMDTHEVTNAAYKAFVDANPQWQKGNIQAKFHDGEYLGDWDGNNYPAGKANHPVNVCELVCSYGIFGMGRETASNGGRVGIRRPRWAEG